MIYQDRIHAEIGIPKGLKTDIHFISIFGMRNSATIPF